MFDWKSKTNFLRDHPRYNDAELFGVTIEPKGNTNWAASVYLLKAEERPGLSFVYIEVLCKQNKRDETRGVLYGWEGMSAEQYNQIGAIFAGKPDNEIKSQFISSHQRIWLEIAGGDKVTGLSSVDSNSYLVLFQEVDKAPGSTPLPNPDPQPAPTPDPDLPVLVGRIQVTINQAQITSLQPDAEGNVTFLVG